MKSLQELISIFLLSTESNIQLDIQRSNDEVLLQIFKQYDVKKWDIDFDITDKNGYCLCIFFNNQKTDNKKNLKRLKQSHFFNDFIYSKSLGVEAYFKMSNNTKPEKLEQFCLDLIKEVYNYEGEINYTLNAY